jgi:branched-chain amino acid transport system ATP-binding protein
MLEEPSMDTGNGTIIYIGTSTSNMIYPWDKHATGTQAPLVIPEVGTYQMLNINKISAFYKRTQALFDISMDVIQGEIVTLLGANGAGKTTTLRTISGLLVPSSGNITFVGNYIEGLSPDLIVRYGISQCPEGRQIFARMTVRENLEMGAYTVKGRKIIEEDFEVVYRSFPLLRERKHQLAGTLSGGEQQMLAMGRALMSRPKLLLLDEPSAGLAPLLVKEILNIIERIQKQGITVLLIEQNANMALSIASRAYVMETGRIVLEGSAKELMSDERVKKTYLGG